MRPKLGFDPLGVPAVPPDVSLPLNMAGPGPSGAAAARGGLRGLRVSVGSDSSLFPRAPRAGVYLLVRSLCTRLGPGLQPAPGPLQWPTTRSCCCCSFCPRSRPSPSPGVPVSPRRDVPFPTLPQSSPALPLRTPRLGLASPSVKPWRPAGVCGSGVAFLRCRRVSELGAHQPPLDGVLWGQGLSGSLLSPVRGPPPRATPVSGLGCVCR